MATSATSPAAVDPEALRGRRIAWDAVSFQVPHNWELTLYKFPRKRVSRVEIEDEYAVRLEAEWTRPKKKGHVAKILETYERATRKLTIKAEVHAPVENLPPGWMATVHTVKETVVNRERPGLSVAEHSLVTAFYVRPDRTLFASFILHFLPDDSEDPMAVTRLIAADFHCHDHEALTPWQLFDIDFELPSDFLLENTLFDIGAKLMIFRWRLRRFYLWHFSCADMFLKDGVDMENWCAGYANSFSRLKAPVFSPDRDGRLIWRRRRRHPLGHSDEIGRWCFRYTARCHRDLERNQLILWVFSHRARDDLNAIPEPLRFGATGATEDGKPTRRTIDDKLAN